MKIRERTTKKARQCRKFDGMEKHVSEKARETFNRPAYSLTKHTCENCGNEILGKFEYVKTQRGEEFYFCKDMQCFKDNKSNSLN